MTKETLPRVITVKNAEGDPDTKATIIKEAKIDYEPKVSVIIPVYNTEEYLRECLDSVVNQTLKEIEIICVDDGSTDSSLEILKEYAEKDNRFTIITQENLHAGVARNAGLAVAKGEYVGFIDSDDLYPYTCTLDNLFNNCTANNVNICGGSVAKIKNDKLFVEKECLKEGFCFKEDKIWDFKDYQFIYGYWRFIYNTKFLQDNKLKFPCYRRFQDPPFFIRAMYFAQRFYALKEVTYKYRVLPKENDFTKKIANDLLFGIINVLKFSREKNLKIVYSELMDRIHSKGIQDVLKNQTISELDYLTYIGPKKIFDDELKKIDKIFKTSCLISSLKDREYFKYFYENNKDIEEFKNKKLKPNYAIVHGFGNWEPQPQTIEYANKNKIPLIKIEDGFLRSADTWCNHTVDKKYTTGISFTFTNDSFYFDGTQSTFMERQINDPDFTLSDEQKERVRNAIKTIVDNHLTKYNHQPIFEPQIGRVGVPKVLIVDQSYGDASIKLGMANDETFKEMLETAIHENPNADIIIKTHPDAIAPGTRRPMAYYSTLESHDNIYILREPINPISILKYVDKVYVCTTQFGFEALMCGKEVHTFGLPFYAGWGLTIDKQKCKRRTAKRTLEELFYIAYIKNTKYIDPINEKECSIERAIEYLIKLRDEFNQYKKIKDEKKDSVLIVEHNNCHAECLPSYINYFLQLNYKVDVVLNKKTKKEKSLEIYNFNPLVKVEYLEDYKIFEKLNSSELNTYKYCFINSDMSYSNKDIIFKFIKKHNYKTKFINVVHRLENLKKVKQRAIPIVLKSFNKKTKSYEVSPLYFGEIKKHVKNACVNFVVAGNIQSNRKNYNILTDCVENLLSDNITNFKITIIGKGDVLKIPDNIQQYFDIKGRLSYSDMYEEMQNADFFLTLLDPDNKDHERYITLGTSGSFQLINGFNLPCLIADKFANIHGYNRKNSIVYENNTDLYDAMVKAINLSETEYQDMKSSLKILSEEIYNTSFSNFKRILKEKPYYLLSIPSILLLIKEILQTVFSIKNEPIRKQHKIITIFGIKFKIKRKQAGGYSFVEKIFSIKNRESRDNKWYKVICILGLKFKYKNKELTQRRQLQALEARLNRVCDLTEQKYKQMDNKLEKILRICEALS